MSIKDATQILVCTSLSDAQLARIQNTRANIAVSDGAALLLQELPEALRPGQALPPFREKTRSLDELFAHAQVILAARRVPTDLAIRAPHLQWVQMPLAGLSGTGLEGVWARRDIVITSAAGINAQAVAEYSIMAMMMLVKDGRRILRSQEERQWDRFDLGQLSGKTVGIVGFGRVGRAVAHLAEPFGVQLQAVKRRVDPLEGLPPWVYPADGLSSVLTQADVLFLCVPFTPATRGMIGRKQLARMKPSAVLINVSRGDVIDQTALATALRQGHLAGAALDVFEEEPLPPNSPFWGLPNALVSGHIAGLFAGYDDAVVDLFRANLDRYLAREPLINTLDREGGY